MSAIYVAIAVMLVLGVLIAGAYLLFYHGPTQVADKGYDLLRRAGSDIMAALQFQPKVIIGEKVVLEQCSAITELVTASRHLEHTIVWEHSWLHSKKVLEIKGRFVAKAGFSIDDSFLMAISIDGSAIRVRHGPPMLICCELVGKPTAIDQFRRRRKASERGVPDGSGR